MELTSYNSMLRNVKSALVMIAVNAPNFSIVVDAETNSVNE